MEEYDKLREMAAGCQGDIEKAATGNKAAGTRVRKAMQEIKAQAQEVRKAVLVKTKKE